MGTYMSPVRNQMLLALSMAYNKKSESLEGGENNYKPPMPNGIAAVGRPDQAHLRDRQKCLDKSGKEARVKSIAKRNIPTITDRQDNSARTDMALPGPISRAGWDRWRW